MTENSEAELVEVEVVYGGGWKVFTGTENEVEERGALRLSRLWYEEQYMCIQSSLTQSNLRDRHYTLNLKVEKRPHLTSVVK